MMKSMQKGVQGLRKELRGSSQLRKNMSKLFVGAGQRRQISTCITFDLDAIYGWINILRSTEPAQYSRGEFGPKAMPAILALLEEYDVKASFGLPALTVESYTEICEEIVKKGHEVVHHGYGHENHAGFEKDAELEMLAKAFEVLDRKLGVKPKGFRSPAWAFSPHTVKNLQELGIEYDSSCFGDDYNPYRLREPDDVELDKEVTFGAVTDIVEIPVSWARDDFPLFEFIPGWSQGLKSIDEVEKMWKDDFDHGHKYHPDGVFNLTMHPQTIGRGGRLEMLRRLIEHFAAQDNVKFETLGECAERWRKENPLEEDDSKDKSKGKK